MASPCAMTRASGFVTWRRAVGDVVSLWAARGRIAPAPLDRALYLTVVREHAAAYEADPQAHGVQLLVAAAHLYGTVLPSNEALAAALERLAREVRGAAQPPFGGAA